MARDTSIVYKGLDQFTGPVNSMKNANQGFSKELEETGRKLRDYRTRQEEVAQQMAKTQTSLLEASQGVKEAKTEYAKLNDETSRTNLEKAYEQYNRLKNELKDYEAVAKDTRRAISELSEQQRRAENQQAGGSGIFGDLGKAGLTQMAGQAFSGLAETMVGSAFGSEVGTMFSSALSGAVSGAALGSLAGPVGTAVGAAVGGGLGLLQGGTQVFEQRDEAFRGYVQEQTEGVLEERGQDITSGSATAAQREQDVNAFNRLLGQGVGDEYLADLRTLAASTPMEYGDLTTMSRSLAIGFKDDPDRMLGLMRDIGDAGSAVGVDTAGMNTMATAMSRMQASGKVTLEYVNLIQERGVDAIGMLSDGLGVTKAKVYDLISKGKIEGSQAVDIIQDKMQELFGGAMELQSKTFAGLTSTLADAETEMRNAYGEGYNTTRKEGIRAQIDYLSGESGAAMQEANRAIGAWQASLENSKEEFIRLAQEEVLNSEEYKAAMARGTDEGYAEAGRMLMEAKVKGMNEYNASDGAQLALESELALAGSIREDTRTNEAFYDAGRRKAEEFSIGLADGMAGAFDRAQALGDSLYGTLGSNGRGGGREEGKPAAFGIDRVPFDGFPAVLHEDERVLTAREARQADRERAEEARGYAYGLERVPRDGFPAVLHEDERVLTAQEARQSGRAGGAAPVQVTVTGNTFYGSDEAMEDRVARKVGREVQRAILLAQP